MMRDGTHPDEPCDTHLISAFERYTAYLEDCPAVFARVYYLKGWMDAAASQRLTKDFDIDDKPRCTSTAMSVQSKPNSIFQRSPKRAVSQYTRGDIESQSRMAKTQTMLHRERDHPCQVRIESSIEVHNQRKPLRVSNPTP